VPRTYKIEVEIALSDSDVERVIRAAKRAYVKSPTITLNEAGEEVVIPADQFIEGPESAVMELIERNPLLDEFRIESLSCVESEHENEDDGDGDPHEWEPGVYVYRWPNGDFSVVQAETRKDALIQLDELGAAEDAMLSRLETFLADFRLNDLGEIELSGFGDDTEVDIRERCYPELDSVYSTPDVIPDEYGRYSPAAEAIIKRAVEHERTRLRHEQTTDPAARTERGRLLQQQLGMAGSVADEYVERQAKRILESDSGEDGKPN
jgi:hypothetical protein